MNAMRKKKLAVPIGTHAGKTVVTGSDHKGVRLKKALAAFLRRRGWRVVDVGPRSEKRVDYPVYAARVARKVGRTQGARAVGIGICGTGIGMCAVASKIPGVVAANPATVAGARETRSHNNSNFLCLAANRLPVRKALRMAEAWLREPFFADPKRDRAYLRRYLQTIRLDRGKR